MITKKEYNKRILLKYLLYSLGVVLSVFVLLWLFKVTHVDSFFIAMENKTFDLRQKIISANKKANKDIIILTIDDDSYEYLFNKYGDWPISRKVYADIVEYIEQQEPVAIAFDLMFVNSKKSSLRDDLYLAQKFKKYKNLYTSINFDSSDSRIRTPEPLPEKLRISIMNYSNLNLDSAFFKYNNCRMILREIINATDKIGHINMVRDDDGFARRMNPFIHYQEGFYPHLALKIALDYINKTEKVDTKNLFIDKNMNIVFGNRKIPLGASGSTVLNWYGFNPEYKKSAFEYIPFWKLEKLTYGEVIKGDEALSKDYFKNKIVYIGTSAASLYDIKSTPIDPTTPGVVLHTTFINNFLDNNFIYHAPIYVDVLVTILLSIIVGFIVLRFESIFIASLTSIMVSVLYIIIATWSMKNYNIWLNIVFPIILMLSAFIGVYLVKYFRKSKDFEYTYKLATTDGLTELYNHRYFQEQMILNIETSKRYESQFSLILVDIDFFKKFNDKFGHQSGDAVLKQVAQTLKKNVRSTDIVCRYGGEEMAVILSNTKQDEALLTAQKLCDSVAERIFDLANNQKEHVTISLGVATYPINGDSSQAIIEHADKGLYKAKENGRNQVGIIEN